MQMVACDLDGVLLRPDGSLGPSAVTAMRLCQERGVAVTWATTRAPWSVRRIAGPYGLTGMAATCLGAAVVDLGSGSTLWSHSITEDDLAAIAALRSNVPGIAFSWTTAKRRGQEADYPSGRRRQSDVSALWDRPGGDPILMVSARCAQSPTQLPALVTETLGDRVQVHAWADGLVDITARGRTKVVAVEEMAVRAGVGQAEVVAFGDTAVDAEMMAWAGRSVAPRSAEAAVLTIADHVVGDCDTEGPANWLIARLHDRE